MAIEDSNCPYVVSDVPGAGRGLIATRDIKKGELILAATPAGLGPQACSDNMTQGMSQCVQCWKVLSQPYTCPRCRLPLCEFNCSLGELHRLECDIFLQIRLSLQASIGNGVFQSWIAHEQDIISSILPLRLLTLKWRDPKTWSLLQNMAVDKMNTSLWNKVKIAFDKFLHADHRVIEADLKHLVGVQSTNGASLHFPSGFGQGIGVYPIQAFLNHECRSNTESMEHPETHEIQIYAKTDISEGAQLTTSYVSSSQPTIFRRQQLFQSWNFWCACHICCDRTENGTFASALASCKKCPGMMLPVNPLNSESDWNCENCQNNIDANTAKEKLQNASEIMRNVDKDNQSVDDLEEVLFKIGKLVAPTNHFWIDVEQKLLIKYMKIEKLSRPMRDRKIQICRNIMDYMQRADSSNVKSKRYLGLYSIILDTEIENLLQDKASRSHRNEELLKKKICEKQILNMIRAKVQ